MLAGHEERVVIPKSDRRADSGIDIEFQMDDNRTIRILQATPGAAHVRHGGQLTGLKIIDSRRPWQTSSSSTHRMGSADFWSIASSQRGTYDDRSDWTYQNAFPVFAEIASDQTKKSKFDEELKMIFPFINDWRLENDLGKNFIEYRSDAGIWHSIALTGEGLINSFMLVASLYDLSDAKVVVIDEPELSLHPQSQRRLFNYLMKKSFETQIIVSTHSPHFVTWDTLHNGIQLFRINPGANAACGKISQATATELQKIAVDDFKNRRMFDALSRELFFSERVIFVEGYEDVHLIENFAIRQGLADLELFGYGAGGADNIEKWLQACKELGVNACAIYDHNKQAAADRAKKKFPEFAIEVLPTDDIRDKPARTFNQPSVKGIFSASGHIKPEFKKYLFELLKRLSG
jgi:hypothetical protein